MCCQKITGGVAGLTSALSCPHLFRSLRPRASIMTQESWDSRLSLLVGGVNTTIPASEASTIAAPVGRTTTPMMVSTVRPTRTTTNP